jgi:hypothetical protein
MGVLAHRGQAAILTEIKRRASAGRLLSVMPWNTAYFPASMKNLPPEVRAKAIDIANALLDEGHPEGQAIRIAIARAKQWAGLARPGRAGRARGL